MRVDLYNSAASQASDELSSQQISTQTAVQSSQVAGEDRATLTSDSTSLETLVSTALSSPEIRQDTVDSLRQAVSNGQYEIDPGQIAASILDEQA
jgi:flagellar biosynthesis anti-sigma factor FlgM